MNPMAMIAGLGTLAATVPRPREIHAKRLGPTVTPRRFSCFAVVVFIFLHMPLALLMKFVPAIATLHALLALAIGLKWAWGGRENVKVAYMGAYITGSEVLWRSVGASVFWEFGKYATALLFIVALVRSHRWRLPALPTIYFLLLIPATILTVFQVSFSQAKNMISFNLSGPFALTVSVIFFVQMQLTRRQFLRLMLAFIGPVMGIVAVILFGFATTDITFGHESNVAASGGFGANQVSALLGMACVAAFLCLLDTMLRWELKILLFGLLVEFAVQSALTFSRAGIYYAAASIVAGCILLMRHLRSAIQLTVILGGVFLVGYYVVYPQLDAYTGGALSARFEDTRLTGRAQIMDADLKIMEEYPVLGIGIGQAMSERAKFFRGFAAHTEFTRLLSEHGSFGCIALVLLVAMGIRNVVVARTNRGRAVAASLVAYSFCFMSGNGMRMVLPSFVFGLASVSLVPDKRIVRQKTPGPTMAKPLSRPLIRSFRHA
ncbi:MAG TPA: O-antigen ligase family protein [Verrucomicrobiae bacterium]|nr:O-antigen ligase family protein [Verrucomicrobiae bacterium]